MGGGGMAVVGGMAGGKRGGKEGGGEKAASTARLLRTVLSWDFFHMLALSKVRERKRQPKKLPKLPSAPTEGEEEEAATRTDAGALEDGGGTKGAVAEAATAAGTDAAAAAGAEEEGMEVEGGAAEGGKEGEAAEAEEGGGAGGETGGGIGEGTGEAAGMEVGEGETTAAEAAAEAAAEEVPEAEAEGEGEEDELREVPVSFGSAEEYVDVFERLLLEECRAQILRGAEEQGGMECQLVVAVRCERANEFHMVGVACKEAVVADCHDNDLLLLAKEKPWGGSALPSTYAIASVESRETKTSLRLRLCLEDPWQWADEGSGKSNKAGEEEEGAGGAGPRDEGEKAEGKGKGSGKGIRWGLRQRARANRMLSFLMGAAASGGSACWVTKLCNTSTICREYAALRSAPSLPYIRTVLATHMRGQGQKQVGAGAGVVGVAAAEEEEEGVGGGEGRQQQWRVPEGLMEYLESSHNDSQLRAIKGGLSRRPLVLIQGPPGTGKTQAILGLLSVVLHGRPAHEMGDAGTGSHPTAPLVRFTWQQRQQQWLLASPWLHGVNPRDAVEPDDEEEEEGAGSSGGNVFGSTQQVEVLGGHRKQRAHVLVCAPSNAALDEIVLRLLHTGLRDDSGGMYSPSVVRVGLNPHHSVASVAMDNLVSQRASSMARSAAGVGAKTAGTGAVERDRIRVAILDEAAIVCSTLAFAGSGVFSRMSRPFDVVVIDEAAQAVEPSTLIPMTHGCSQVFMVGDPLQLPATVLSTRAVHYGYHGSMFSRLQQAGYPVVMLNTQYRMHPMIRQFPSSEFYGGALKDAPQMAQNTARPWHAERLFGPLFFFDLHQSKDEQPPGGSWMNKDEAEFVMVLYRHLVALYPQLKDTSDVGVISPYKHQVKLLRDKFRELLGETAHKVDVNTVDGFQGREKDVIIFSCVRAGRGKGKSIGFLSDYRRMNVGITRARSSMLVVANASALMVDEHWGNLVRHARTTNRYLKVSRPFHKIFASEHLEKMRALAEAEGGEEGAAGPAFKRAPTLEDYGGELDKGDGGAGGEGEGVQEGGGEEEGEEGMGGEEDFVVADAAGDFDEDNLDGEGPSW
ncbi:hypothetical protein CLOM_g3376 [Closterium sp. NIES-68]|nr:hypothetical protein CLOM_g3376 [Closterium sp. NIES-68]